MDDAVIEDNRQYMREREKREDLSEMHTIQRYNEEIYDRVSRKVSRRTKRFEPTYLYFGDEN